jgi:hypothetical protein
MKRYRNGIASGILLKWIEVSIIEPVNIRQLVSFPC